MTDEKIKEVTTYKFERSTTYSNGEQFTDVKIFTEDALEGCYSVVWEDVANIFLLWLGGIYGYDIRGQVELPSDRLQVTKEFYDPNEQIFGVRHGMAQTAQDCPGCACCKA